MKHKRIDCKFKNNILVGNNEYAEGTVELHLNSATGQPDFILRLKNRPGACLAMSSNHYPVIIDERSFSNSELIKYLEENSRE